MVSYDTRIRTINGQYATNSDTNSSSSKTLGENNGRHKF